MDGVNLSTIVGGVVSILLSIIAYFLHLLIQDIRQLKQDQIELRELFIYLKAEQKSTRDWIEAKIKSLRIRSPTDD